MRAAVGSRAAFCRFGQHHDLSLAPQTHSHTHTRLPSHAPTRARPPLSSRRSARRLAQAQRPAEEGGGGRPAAAGGRSAAGASPPCRFPSTCAPRPPRRASRPACGLRRRSCTRARAPASAPCAPRCTRCARRCRSRWRCGGVGLGGGATAARGIRRRCSRRHCCDRSRCTRCAAHKHVCKTRCQRQVGILGADALLAGDWAARCALLVLSLIHI